jgi:thymidylate synthase
MQADKTIEVDDLDEAICRTLDQIVKEGSRILVGGTLSTAAGRTTYEILNYSIRVTNPRRRLPANRELRFNAIAAVSRFVWMMSASDRVSDIAFYQPRAAEFSDDDLTIPGSSYGRRILSPRPGLNQLAGVIDRLKDDPNSRRAFISVYQAEDSVRVSKDIPCLLTLGYHIRDGRLYGTTTMRANNAFGLFPYNFFEFSLLAEIIAVELGVDIGPMTHSAVSMHIYGEDVDRSEAVVRAWSSNVDSSSIEIPLAPLSGVRELALLEPIVKTVGHLSVSRLECVLSEADQRLTGVWREMFQVLVIHALRSARRIDEANSLSESLAEPWRRYLVGRT